MPESKPHLSPSQLSMFYRCGMQYYFRYMLGERKPPGIALVVGRSVHETVEADMLSKLHEGELLSDEDIKGRANDTAKAYLEEDVVLSADEKKRGEKKVKGAAVNEAVALSICHHKKLAPKIEPDQVERGVRLVLKAYPFDIEGRLDLRDTKGRVHDTKTAKNKWPQRRVDTDTGLTFYHWASKIIGPPHSKTVYLDCLTKTKTPMAVTISSSRSKKDHEVLLRRAINVWEAIGAGIFIPCSPDAWVCCRKFCGYFGNCKYATRERRRPKK